MKHAASIEVGARTTAIDRVISFGEGLPAIPEKLLLAHARGEVLFIAGAGVSQPAGLPSFEGLTLNVYEELDLSTHAVLLAHIQDRGKDLTPEISNLKADQAAEVRRFMKGDFDVVLGMLERRMDFEAHTQSKVRRVVANKLRGHGKAGAKFVPQEIHRALISLADRGGPTCIITTNFDLLLEDAGKHIVPRLQTYSLGSIPRPSRKSDFSGVLHIHGALDPNAKRTSDLIVSDQDFGEFYFRRRVVPDFIYDAARLYSLVLIGYSANDAPMRYLLNAVAADGSRFSDFQDRFTFIGSGSFDPIEIEDWRGRGIVPVWYDSANQHGALLKTLQRWADLSAHNKSLKNVKSELKRIVQTNRMNASDSDRDLFDHLFRRDKTQRQELTRFVSNIGAGFEWLNAIIEISSERETV